MCVCSLTMELNRVVTDFGLTISVPKTKLLIAGSRIMQDDLMPICIDGELLKRCPPFAILGVLWRVVMELHWR